MLATEIRSLGHALGRVISRIEGEAILQTEEQLRQLAKARRSGLEEATGSLLKLVQDLDTHEALEMAMAFTTYFELVNLAEENYRVHLLRERSPAKGPRRESIAIAIAELKKRGITPEQLQGWLDQLSIELVLTAHPTEVKRRTMLTKLKRLAAILRARSAPGSRPFFRRDDGLVEQEITSLWLTDRSRTTAPEVTDEVKTGLWYFDMALWETVPYLQQALGEALAEHYPTVHPPKRWMTFGSWIGGDRDGNPNVTAKVTAEALILHRKLALEKLRLSIHAISRLVSVSTSRDRISPEMDQLLKSRDDNGTHARAIENRYPHEPYRQLLAGLRIRLAEEEAYDDLPLLLEGGSRKALSAKEVVGFVDTLRDSLRKNRGALLAEGELRMLDEQLAIFGLHMAKLDLRQHSSRHEAAVGEILQATLNESDYAARDEAGKLAVLGRALREDPAQIRAQATSLSEATQDILRPLEVAGRAQALYGRQVIGIYIISMTDALSDVLEALWLMKLTGTPLCIAPLFETLDDLQRAPKILQEMFDHPVYREHLRARGDLQTVMIGYSDSNKDCGYVTANWALFKAQESIVPVATQNGIKLSLFHGRGGSIARGGGPAAKAILAQPCGLKDGRIRVTEQGEVLSTRYHDPDLAFRILEQMAYGVLLGSAEAQNPEPLNPKWRAAMETMAQAGFAAYKQLVHDDPDFIPFWKQATPIDEISMLKLGSRPAFRKQTQSVEDLRAIPWVFSWMQSRFVFPGWYGLGSALEAMPGPAGEAVLQEMYRDWIFFQTLVDNAQLTLLKADIKIAEHYASLVRDEAMRNRIFGIIRAEFERTEKAILKITRQNSLLERDEVLRRSIQLRNPYIDPLNFLQVEMLRRLRSRKDLMGGDDAALRSVIELTINGVSGGLKNTG
jgi:phosphoenolpyruvate carboxylase